MRCVCDKHERCAWWALSIHSVNEQLVAAHLVLPQFVARERCHLDALVSKVLVLEAHAANLCIKAAAAASTLRLFPC